MAAVHCENTSGIVNPVAALGAVAARHGRPFLVDGMSSFGALPLDLAASYRVVVNNSLAAGGDNFSVLVQGQDRVGGAIDLDALIAWVGAQPGRSVSAPAPGRIAVLP